MMSCISSRHGIKLSKFSYNNKNLNAFIENRIPDYGDGHTEGCVITGQIFLSINSSDNKINGILRDVETLEPLIGANVSIWFQVKNDSIIVISDSKGEFEIVNQLKIAKI